MIESHSVSVIFPVYNEEAILNDSLNEVTTFLDQSFKNWEMVIVESGSSDASPHIVDEFALKNNKSLVQHQKKKRRIRLGIETSLCSL